MADAVISLLSSNLTRILSQEADLILGVEDEVKSLQNQLKLTQSYLQRLPQKRNDQAIMVEFINQVRNAAREAEDTIDAYVATVYRQRKESFLFRLKGELVRLLARRKAAEEIKAINSRFEEIFKNKERFDIQIGDQLPMEDDSLMRRRRLIIEETDVFLEVLGHDCSSSLLNSRRLGLHSNILKHISSTPSATKLRSILCFGLDERQLSSNEWKLLYKSFPLLRVLDVWGVGVEAIPNEIDKLIHQRYLRLKSLTAQTLPASICNLWNLQTLEVIAPCIDRPPIDIWKLQELRHLYFHGQAVLPEPPILKAKDSTANVLSNLLTLSCISPDSCKESVFSMLPNLLKLGINGDLEKHRTNLTLKNLSKLNHLQTLKLERDRRCEELINLRDGIKFPPNLTKLTLLETQLLEDPMDVLGRLPNLQVLKLKNAAYGGRDLCCSGNGFPKLQVLKLVNLAIRCWTISEGSMPSLRSVVINRCGNLEGLPSALPNIPAFEELELWSPHVSLVKEAKEIEMSPGKEKFKLVIYQS
ncbi:Disease resistance RPP8-like protein 3 [Camellia lanceoleosa]|uniref:Disease resistance RPP8-like protein 3 n=1 Tax=Camellia lanceoleosa TaxID=1840588 RepID=A0ACC0G6S1_9ERIC|nr:Disease resistance RPP8-like protein 3 [Camellia lanceoleosa]